MRTRHLAPAAASLAAMALLAAAGGPAGATPGGYGHNTNSTSNTSTGGVAAPATPGAPTIRADFNGDGAEDLAVGTPFESVGAVPAAGTVIVLYGSPGGGLAGPGSQLFNQESAGIASDAEQVDLFGWALATGDFDDDGLTDLAIGASGEDVGTVESAGAVQVLYGTATGLTTTGSQLFTQDTAGIGSTAEVADFFGDALTAGDFDGDGADDLAVGADFESVGDRAGAGAVNVLYGAAGTGLSGAGSTQLTQAGPDVHSEPEPGDRFGATLAAADFDADGLADLAVGAPGEASGLFQEAGAVNVFDGSAGGVTTAGSLIFTQNVAGIGSEAEPFDFFGDALAAADVDADGFADLAVGVPNESVGDVEGAGAIHVLRGSGAGLSGTGSQLLTQDVGDIGSTAEPFDNFGAALAAGDFDADGAADVAVGSPFESVGAAAEAGMVTVLRGSTSGGVSAADTQQFVQGAGGVGSTSELLDAFGLALASADFDGDGDADLAIGAPSETVGSVEHAGAVFVLDGTGSGLTGTGSQLFHQGVAGIGSDPEPADAFGQSLAATRTPAG